MEVFSFQHLSNSIVCTVLMQVSQDVFIQKFRVYGVSSAISAECRQEEVTGPEQVSSADCCGCDGRDVYQKAFHYKFEMPILYSCNDSRVNRKYTSKTPPIARKPWCSRKVDPEIVTRSRGSTLNFFNFPGCARSIGWMLYSILP